MIEYIVFGVSSLISNIITINIIIHFVKEHYTQTYENKGVYICSFIMMVIFMCSLNTFKIPILNCLGYLIITGVYSIILYTSNNKKYISRFFNVIILVLILMVCESIGVLLLKLITPTYIIYKGMLYDGFSIMFSNIVVVFMYYLVFSKIWLVSQEYMSHYIPSQTCIYIVLGIFNIINIILILCVLPLMKWGIEQIILLFNMAFIVIVDVLLIYFLKYSKDNENLKIKLKLLEQQSELEYSFYNEEKKRYSDSKKILHDVNKHIKMIEELYNSREDDKALMYTKQINTILEPMLPEVFTDEVILNILLNEKQKQAKIKGINITFSIKNICLDFMNPIEITTIFGNLLENAFEACEKCKKGRDIFISLEVETYNDIIVVGLKNSCNIIKWGKDYPVSAKREHQGIGLINIEKIVNKYDGNITMKEEKGVFYCNLFWCKKVENENK